MSLAIPELPRSVRASTLLNGSDADFVINAYLALQRQWPDAGGYGHYLFALGQPQGSRAAVLREIAASDNARRCGIEFIDDLPHGHVFRPEDHDRSRLTELSLSLRVGRTVADLEQLRRAVASLTTESLAGAVQTIVHAQQAHQSTLESRLNELDASVRALDSAAPVVDVAAAPVATSGNESAPSDTAAWRHLAQRQILVERELLATRETVKSLASELTALRGSFADLHRYATVQLKRQVADYVNALSLAQAAQVPAAQTPPSRRAARVPVTTGERFVSLKRAERG